MTDKRFTLNVDGVTINDGDDRLCGQGVVDLLNELYEENQTLKQNITNLLNDEKYWEKKAKQQINELKTENQQLYEDNIRIKQLIATNFNQQRTQLGKNAIQQIMEQI